MFDNIRIILVNPTHPGNIGAAARAMKTMGLHSLYLVTPKRFPDAQATDRAAHAADILQNACVVPSLQEALQDCDLIFATSARLRALTWPVQELRQAAALTLQQTSQSKVAFVFGREHSGLTNEEVELCHYQIEIPANPEYSSLNLAAAVQVICYEIRMAWLGMEPAVSLDVERWSTSSEMESFYLHLERVMVEVEFLKPGLSGQVVSRLRRLFSRSRIERREMNILRGILSAVEKKLGSV